ncbi:CobW family GTP-binding protein [Rhodococcus sp. NPDC054953]
MARRRIPVVLVAGFLGSGKTSLLNHLLRGDHGVRIGVIVNDFGAVNIDAMMVAGQVDSTVALSNGCLCCAVDVGELDAMLDRLTRADLDVIVIEASGLAEPRTMVRMLLASDNPGIGFGGLVVVVDAAGIDDASARHPELDLHVRMADLLVLNKIDLCDGAVADAVRERVAGLNDRSPMLETTHGRIDPRLLFDEVVRVDDGPRQLSLDELLLERHHECGEHEHLHDQYRSVSFTSRDPIDPRALVRFLEDPPAGLYRMKGAVYFGIPGHTQRYLLQTVGRHIRFDRTPWGRGRDRGTELVLIGSGLDGDAALRRLGACVAEPAHVSGAEAMTGVHRYVVGD